MDSRQNEVGGLAPPERWTAWPVYWSAVWVGALAALATALVIGLIGVAVGAQVVKGEPWVDLRKVTLGALVFSVVGAFLAFVVGGWVAGKIAGIRRSETSMLHGAIVWLVAVPLLVAMIGLGAGNSYGGWYGGLGSRTVASATGEPKLSPDDAAAVARNTAIGAVTALLLGLVGGVVGGWLASGEPMSLTHYRTRTRMNTTAGYHSQTTPV